MWLIDPLAVVQGVKTLESRLKFDASSAGRFL
jgi:hypothetical protein